MIKKAFLKKAIPLVIVFLFVVVAFSPIYANSTGISSAHQSSVNVPLISSSNIAPVWAFDGAYLNYTLTVYEKDIKSSGYFYVEISGVNTKNGTINASLYTSNEYINIPPVYENNTSWNNFLFAYNNTDLSMFNNGKIPALMNESIGAYGANITTSISTNISLHTGMGTLPTDRVIYTISDNNTSMNVIYYVSQRSGVMLGMNEVMPTEHVNETLLLHSTNINLSSSNSILKINVFPHDASVTMNGIYLHLISGSTSLFLPLGPYYVSVSAPGYVPELKEVNMMTGRTEYLNVTLTRSTSPTYNISGFVSPGNASVMFDGYSVSVNSYGYYNISLPSGTYVTSVTDTGYYSFRTNVTLNSNIANNNFTLAKEPKPTSTKTLSNVTANGYNVTVSKILSGTGNISVTYTATSNGTITVALSYTQVKNTTISYLLSSKIYINGTQYKNFSVALSSSGGTYTAILTVHNLTGDPTLVWQYSPAVSTPTPTPKSSPVSSAISSTEIIIIIGVIAIVAIVGVALVMKRRK